MLALPLLLLLTHAVSDVQRSDGEVTFRDVDGAHRVRLVFQSPENGGSRRVIITHEARKTEKAAWKKVWEAKDFVNDCEFDLSLDVSWAQATVTDLDNDGVGEFAFTYVLGCRSDVSPLTMKLLMYEGSSKYALRGTNRVRVSDKDFEGGTFEVDAAFKKAPASFLEHAKAQWAEAIK